MKGDDLPNVLMGMVKRAIGRVVGSHTQLEEEEWDLDGTVDSATSTLIHEDIISKKDLENKSAEKVKNYLVVRTQEVSGEKPQQLNGQEQLLEFEKVIVLCTADTEWTDYVDAMDRLRQSVGLRAHGQNNPLAEY